MLAGLGMGLTGDIDCLSGICYSMKRFPGLEGAPLRDRLQQRLGVPVQILNDGLTAALGELRAGAGREVQDFVMVTLGTGIGGGVVLGGRLLTGARGRIGKVGHQIIDADIEVDCHCGLRGCWQGLAGKGPIEQRTRAFARAHPDSALARLGEAVDLKQVAVLAAAGDVGALAVMEETGRYVGIGLANLVKIFAPQQVILGGGVAEGNPALLAAAQRTVDLYAIKPYQRVPVVPAALGWEAGVLGATFLTEEGLLG